MKKSIERIRNLRDLSSLSFNWRNRWGSSAHDESWFTKVPLKLEYNFIDDLVAQLDKPRHRSFNRCFSKTLTSYGNGIYMNREKVLDLKNKNGVNHSLNEANLNFISNSLITNDDSIIKNQRLKVARFNAPFYIHQQFQLNLLSNDLTNLIQLYFDLPSPRPMYLKRNEFENFISLLLKFNPNEQPELLSKVIKVFEDIFYKGGDIKLTKSERVKLFSLNVKKTITKEHQHHQSSVDLNKSYQFLNKLRTTIGIDKTCDVWIILNSNFPNHSKTITSDMCKHIGINRIVLPMILKSTTSAKQLHNILKLVKMKNIHIDNELINIIICQFLHLGMIDDSIRIVNGLIMKFSKNLNPIKIWKLNGRKFIKKLNILNLARNGTIQMKEDSRSKKSIEMNQMLIPYPILPSPLTIGKLLTFKKISNEQILELILNVKINQYPLSYQHIFQLISKIEDFDCLRTILEILLNIDDIDNPKINSKVKEFNDVLYDHHNNINTGYNVHSDNDNDNNNNNNNNNNNETNGSDEILDERQWLLKILKSGVETHDRIINKGTKEIDELVKNRVQSLLVDLNSILNK